MEEWYTKFELSMTFPLFRMAQTGTVDSTSPYEFDLVTVQILDLRYHMRTIILPH